MSGCKHGHEANSCTACHADRRLERLHDETWKLGTRAEEADAKLKDLIEAASAHDADPSVENYLLLRAALSRAKGE